MAPDLMLTLLGRYKLLIISLHAGYFLKIVLSSAAFFHFFFQNDLSVSFLECQMVWDLYRSQS